MVGYDITEVPLDEPHPPIVHQQLEELTTTNMAPEPEPTAINEQEEDDEQGPEPTLPRRVRRTRICDPNEQIDESLFAEPSIKHKDAEDAPLSNAGAWG